MKLMNDELIVWKNRSHMIFNGEPIFGEINITNKRVVFTHKDVPGFLPIKKKDQDFWELDIGRIKEVNMHSVKGADYPVIRIHYKEDDVFLTFPDHEPRSTLASLIIFINHARMIEKMMSVMRNIDLSLKKGTLEIGEKIPELTVEYPAKADEECYQCGKTLLDEEIDNLSEEYQECLSCVPDMHG
ncbi:MAG: hypothetical protein ACMUIG_10795 [Thermoplasmatota archaeon]